jgi:DNA-binding FadR family transcriptional regulator
MMQNGEAVSRRSAKTLVAPSAGLVPRFAQTLVADVLHRCEVWTLLECHAVSRAALSPHRDVHTLRSVFPELNHHVLSPHTPADWQHLEVGLHRAIAEQAGNPLLAMMLAEVGSQLEDICSRHISRPIHRPGTLWLLQCQHRKILSCIEAGGADEAVLHTRAHLHLIRDQLVAALSA